MNLKKGATIFCFFFALLDANGQYFSKRYPLTLAGYISSIQVVNDTIYAMCQVVDTVPPYKNIGDFVKFDKNGNILSQSFFDIPSKTQIGANFNTLIKTNDGGFAYGGYANDTTAFQSVIIIKYDRDGRFQWYKELSDTNYYAYYCLSIIQDSFSNYYFTGSVTTKGLQDLIEIDKTDSLGNLIYMKVFGSHNEHSGANGLCINSKGHIVLGGGTGNTDPNNYTTSVDYFIVYELDTGGNILNQIVHASSDGPYGGYIKPLLDGNYMVANIYTCMTDTYTITWHGAIALLDSDFNVVWQIDTGPCSQMTMFLALSSTDDVNFIAVGQSQDLNDTIYDHQNGWIIKFSENGTIIWDKLYRGFSDTIHLGDVNLLASLGFLSNGDLIAAGQASDNANVSYATQGWLLRLDTAGCIPDSTDCGQVPSGIADIIASSPALVSVYPNPAGSEFTIDVISGAFEGMQFRLYDLTGRMVSEQALTQPSTTIQRGALPDGMYLYHISGSGSSLSNGKLVLR